MATKTPNKARKAKNSAKKPSKPSNSTIKANPKKKPDLAPKRGYRRGEIYYIHECPEHPSRGNEIWSDRAGVIVSNDVYNTHSGVAMVVYLTSAGKNRTVPTHVALTSKGKEVIALCEQIHTVDASRIGDYMDRVSENDFKNLEEALMFALNLNPHSASPQGIYKKWERHIQSKNLAVDHGQVLYDPLDHIKHLETKLELANKEKDAFKLLYENSEAKLKLLKN